MPALKAPFQSPGTGGTTAYSAQGSAAGVVRKKIEANKGLVREKRGDCVTTLAGSRRLAWKEKSELPEGGPKHLRAFLVEIPRPKGERKMQRFPPAPKPARAKKDCSRKLH